MSGAAVRVQGLGKRYRIGAAQERHDSLRFALAHALAAPARNLRRLRRLRRFDPSEEPDVVWAIRDVAFEVRQGEVLGVIGRNGAGKSTLLKILSRITKPTTGRAEIRGRVGALLEVGTGFHPELTGRENVYLNGSILGMDSAYLDRRFEEIVEFAELAKFIDTPVKRYSSGMYLRLAFAVAAHLEPEILVVDEVLAVGDAAFQQKCLGKMSDVAGSGRTVLFVSHNMGAVRRLCERAVVFERGRLVMDAATDAAIGRYLAEGDRSERAVRWANGDAPQTPQIVLRGIHVVDGAGQESSTLSTADPISVVVEYELKEAVRGLRIYLALMTPDGVQVFITSDVRTRNAMGADRPGRYVSRCTIPGGLLNVGTYIVMLGVDVPGSRQLISSTNYLDFTVTEMIDNPLGDNEHRLGGVVKPRLDWAIERDG